MGFTEEQLHVIDTRNKNVLVSAAAGSGKTTVLVERILRMVLDKEHPLEIDRLLVVTFTEAAAAQMRERIGDAIEKALEKDPSNMHLVRQSALLYKAQISTIHSFCLSVIRNQFQKIGLDPSFRVADETELKLMAEDVLEELFEEKYAAGDEDFLSCVDYFITGVGDDALREYVLKMASFAEGYPWPEEWIEDCAGQYNITDVTEFNNSKAIKWLMSHAGDLCGEALALSGEALRITKALGGPAAYLDLLLDDREKIERLLKSKTYGSLREDLAGLAFGRLPKSPGEGAKEESVKAVKNLREAYKDIFNVKKAGNIRSFFAHSEEEEILLLKKTKEAVGRFCALTFEFAGRFRQKRMKKGVIGFSDMEYYALRILYDEKEETDENGKKRISHVPSAEALELAEEFDEILMDEYQDCNRVQELIVQSISGEDRGRFHRFMVGDVKQSIYKFRMASPELFIDKAERYPVADRDGRSTENEERIDLHKNFRSRKTVIDTVNDLFGHIMHKPVGGVEYDEDARLTLGAEYPSGDPAGTAAGASAAAEEKGEAPYETEILLREQDGIPGQSKGVQEAQMIAQKIRALMKTLKVKDKKSGELRPLRYRDIVILLRSMTDVAEGIKQVFASEGIPAFLSLNTGFYDAKEIRTVIELLKIIDNPLQDIPLYGSLHSFFGGFSNAELAEICASGKAKSPSSESGSARQDRMLFDILNERRASDPKVERFLSFLEDYRVMSTYTPIHELITKLVYETGYMDHITALPGGDLRKANVRRLIRKAAAFEQTSYRGLFHFLRYVKELKKTSTQEGEAEAFDENADVVRVMTIHKSKGLEFPVCFLSGVHKNFNRSDTSGIMILSMDSGPAVSYMDIENRLKIEPLKKKITIAKMKEDMIGEELRVLYVAMTRACEKLIITGVVNKKEADELRAASDASLQSIHMTDHQIAGAKGYIDLLAPLLPGAKILSKEDLSAEGAEFREKQKSMEDDLLTRILLPETGMLPEYRSLRERMERKYPHEELKGLILKTSVSELKKAYLDTEGAAELYDAEKIFAPEKELPAGEEGGKAEGGKAEGGKKEGAGAKLGGSERGSAYHKIMELLDLNNANIKAQINLFVENKKISKDWADAVSVNKIERFLSTPLAKRMASAQKEGRLKKEQPFVMGIRADRANPSYPETETVLLQGIIDAYFVEDGKIILLDYKTDVIENGTKLLDRYRIQLAYYSEALEKILGMPVSETLLYSFYLNEVVGA